MKSCLVLLPPPSIIRPKIDFNLHFHVDIDALMRTRLTLVAALDLLEKNETLVSRKSPEYHNLQKLIEETESNPALGKFTGLRTVPSLPLHTHFHTSHTIHNRLIS